MDNESKRIEPTVENVERVMEELEGSGANPTYEAVRNRLGGGNYRPIGQAIRAVLAKREAEAKKKVHLPQEIQSIAAKLGQDFATRVFDLAQNQFIAAAKLRELERETADKQSSDQIREMEAEIDRLEKERSDLNARCWSIYEELRASRLEVARAEAVAEERSTELSRIRAMCDRALEGERAARAEADLAATEIAALRRSLESGSTKPMV